MLATIPLPPVGTNHAYHTSNDRWYKDTKITTWERECLYILKDTKPALKKDEYKVIIDFYFGNKRKNDIDGRIKPVLDLLTKAGIYTDDSLVTALMVTKKYDKAFPRCTVLVS